MSRQQRDTLLVELIKSINPTSTASKTHDLTKLQAIIAETYVSAPHVGSVYDLYERLVERFAVRGRVDLAENVEKRVKRLDKDKYENAMMLMVLKELSDKPEEAKKMIPTEKDIVNRDEVMKLEILKELEQELEQEREEEMELDLALDQSEDDKDIDDMDTDDKLSLSDVEDIYIDTTNDTMLDLSGATVDEELQNFVDLAYWNVKNDPVVMSQTTFIREIKIMFHGYPTVFDDSEKQYRVLSLSTGLLANLAGQFQVQSEKFNRIRAFIGLEKTNILFEMYDELLEVRVIGDLNKLLDASHTSVIKLVAETQTLTNKHESLIALTELLMENQDVTFLLEELFGMNEIDLFNPLFKVYCQNLFTDIQTYPLFLTSHILKIDSIKQKLKLLPNAKYIEFQHDEETLGISIFYWLNRVDKALNAQIDIDQVLLLYFDFSSWYFVETQPIQTVIDYVLYEIFTEQVRPDTIAILDLFSTAMTLFPVSTNLSSQPELVFKSNTFSLKLNNLPYLLNELVKTHLKSYNYIFDRLLKYLSNLKRIAKDRNTAKFVDSAKLLQGYYSLLFEEREKIKERSTNKSQGFVELKRDHDSMVELLKEYVETKLYLQ